MNSLTNKRILLVGAGGHARSCIDVLETANWEIVGLFAQREEVGTTVLGYPVIGTSADLADHIAAVPFALVVIGQIESPAPRIMMFECLQKLGFQLPVVISPKAHVSRHACILDGSIVMHGAVVNAGAIVGRNCIVNTQALVEHDAEVGDHCHISTRATLNGGVRVGRGSFVGSGAVVRQETRIGEGCFIGMGSVIRRDCPDLARVTRGN